jgi:hypothetical protein
MEEEYNSLISNNTWRMVTKPPGRNLVRNKWIFKLKYDVHGNVDRFKARLVAKGFSQTPGVDFDETYSPIVRFESIRTILSVATVENLHITQFNVKTAFLLSEFTEQIFMAPTPGFEDRSEPGLVCELLQSLYGLKQSGRYSSKKFNAFLQAYNLHPYHADPYVYVSQTRPRLILMLFIDDGIICCESKQPIKDILVYMGNAFTITTGNP